MEDQPNFSLAFDLPRASSQANKSNENKAQQSRFPHLSKQELGKILAKRPSAATKTTTNWFVATFKGKYLCCAVSFSVTFVKPIENQLITKSTKQSETRTFLSYFHFKNITATLKHG